MQWLDALEEHERGTYAAAQPEPPTPEPQPVVEDTTEWAYPTPEFVEPSFEPKNTGRARKSLKWLLIIVLIVCLLTAAGIGAWVLTQKMFASSQSPLATASPTAETQPGIGLKDTAQIGNSCKAATPEVVNEASPRGAVARFETAYYSADSEALLASLSQNSKQRNQAWEEILPVAAPEGTRWCVTIDPVDRYASSVNFSIVSVSPSGETKVFKQTATTVKEANTWVVQSIAKQGATT